ncbi:alcohol dehydrogenase [Mycena leptocephala]|nr:alcohol dehydrogenase [Mycena leptocephala]
MAPITNARVLFAAIPKEIDLDTVPLNGGFLIRTLVLSISYSVRFSHFFRASLAYFVSPQDAFILAVPRIDGYGVGVVAAGKHVYGILPHQQYTVLPGMEGLTFLENDAKLPWTVFVGKTAFMGWKEFSRAKKVRARLLSNLSSPVGCMVIQLAKRDGLKVIASAGSDEKVQFMREIGADVAFNYRARIRGKSWLARGPLTYWDNVGGKMLDAALEHAALHGRILECGTISGYNTGYEPVMNIHLTWAKSLTISGILIFHLQDKYDEEFYATIPKAIAAGEIKYTEEISRGLESVGDAILRVQQGKNVAKAVVVVAEE